MFCPRRSAYDFSVINEDLGKKQFSKDAWKFIGCVIKRKIIFIIQTHSSCAGKDYMLP